MIKPTRITLDGTDVLISVQCPCGTESVVRADVKAYEGWLAGDLAQVAFPEMPTEEREKLISGLCDECQEVYFND